MSSYDVSERLFFSIISFAMGFLRLAIKESFFCCMNCKLGLSDYYGLCSIELVSDSIDSCFIELRRFELLLFNWLASFYASYWSEIYPSYS